jgi:hypothetical protein
VPLTQPLQERHYVVCRKQKEKKRAVFDSSKQRQITDGNEDGQGAARPSIKSGVGSIKANEASYPTKLPARKPIKRTTATGSQIARPVKPATSDPINSAKKSSDKRQTVTSSSSNGGSLRSSVNAYVQCPACQRNFSRAASERHIPWCQQKQRSARAPSSSNSNTEEALARFRARNGYQPLKQKGKGRSFTSTSGLTRSVQLPRK